MGLVRMYDASVGFIGLIGNSKVQSIGDTISCSIYDFLMTSEVMETGPTYKEV